MGRKARIRSKRRMTYHGRTGKPLIHKAKTSGRKYIRVRKKGGGTKRLYMDSKRFKREVTVHK